MFSDGLSGRVDETIPSPVRADAPPMTRWQKFRLVVKVVELRLRFIALMAWSALVFANT